MSERHEVITRIAAKVFGGANMLEVALTLAEAGVVFFPCAADKTPRISGWQNLNAVGAGQARAWLKRWPRMMLGLPAGANGLLVIDLDKAKQAHEMDGLEEYEALCGKHGHDFMDSTLCAKTGSGGLHIFYQMPASHKLRNTAKRLGKAIDTRGHGGYVIIAPSIGKRGKYEWLNQNPIAPLPDWLLSLLTREKKQQTNEPFTNPILTYGDYVNKRERNAYQSAFVGECDNVATAVEGTRNDVLNVASYNLGRYVAAGKLNEAKVYDALYEAAQKCGLATGEIGKTISSGLNSGKQKPKVIKPRGGSWELKENMNVNEASKHDKQEQDSQPIALKKYLAEANAEQQIKGFLNAALEFSQCSAIPTGYANLDALLDGGLYPGLYVIGAISSLGKTTFALQMADAIAQSGHDVLIFSLEMSRHELIAKSMSRIASLEDESHNPPEEKARTARHYLSGKWCAVNATEEESSYVFQMLNSYAKWARHIYIIEGSYKLDALGVTSKTKKHIQLTGNKPVVIVDYLQILAPLNDRYTDKQNVDRGIVELKRLSRDLKLPVIAVSSFNRDSYTTKATMSAFKESGAIEYTSDVLIGLQFKGMSDKNFDVDAAKKSNPREIELLLIKNRHGQCGEAQFRYYPKFNRFTD